MHGGQFARLPSERMKTTGMTDKSGNNGIYLLRRDEVGIPEVRNVSYKYTTEFVNKMLNRDIPLIRWGMANRNGKEKLPNTILPNNCHYVLTGRCFLR